MNNDDKKTTDNQSESGKSKSDRVIGEGMTSLDSTQAPLKAETGLPDREAMTGGKEPSARDENEKSK
jgi:hypothetical protein